MLFEEACTKIESYIYHATENIVDDEEAVNALSSEEQCAEVHKLAKEA